VSDISPLRSLRFSVGIALLLGGVCGAQTLVPRNRPDWGKLTTARMKAIFAEFREQDAGKAKADGELLLGTVAAYAPLTETQAFIDAAFTARLTDQLACVTDKDQRIRVLDYLLKHDELARELAFTIRPEEKPEQVYAVLLKLIDARGEQLADYPTLTAALCVVHDVPMVKRINENTAKSDNVVNLFDYYVKNEKKMLFGIKGVPTDLLIWVVDTTASVEEMNWALGKFAGDREAGKLFFKVKYDFDHLRTGRPKMVTVKGFSLPNILQYGGVCADQAYFAMTVAKAIGDPSAYVTAQSGEVGHAWVGFLQPQGRTAAWNFNLGRYPEYQGLRGVVEDPQTHHLVYDGFVAVRAELIRIKGGERDAAKALVTAAIMFSRVKAPAQLPAVQAMDADPATEFGTPRANDADQLLVLLDAAARHNPCLDEVWFALRSLASQNRLTLSQKKSWADKLQRLTGKKYPDFMFAILEPMIQTIDDPREQNNLWEAAFALMTLRKDLAAEVRMKQAALWEKQNKPDMAGKCYEDVINRFANDGPFVVTALEKTEQMLDKSGLGKRVVQLYGQTWKQLDKPSGMAGSFAQQSNWYRVGLMYAKKLNDAGQTQQANEVQSQLKQVVGGGVASSE